MTPKEKMRAIFAAGLGVEPENISPTSTLEDLGGDSLDSIIICIEVEHTFNCQISDDTWEACKTFEDYCRQVPLIGIYAQYQAACDSVISLENTDRLGPEGMAQLTQAQREKKRYADLVRNAGWELVG